jgi:glucose 1-dehydrogenase
MSEAKLNGRVAIVTGAARGIGAASAIELAASGADVVLNDLKPAAEAAATVERIEALGRRAVYVQGDVATPEVNAALVEAAVRQLGRVDIVVANAGRGLRKPFVEVTVEEARSLFDLIYWAGFYLGQAAARQMIKQGWGGAMVFISSVHAVGAYANAVAYNAAKAALNHTARTMALELAPHRIRVNWIEPGWIDTPGERLAFGDATVERGGELLVWGRLGRPEEIAKGVLFLASDDSSYMTGAGLRIDGGYTLPAGAVS